MSRLVVPTTARAGETITVDGFDFDRRVKFALTTVDANGLEVGLTSNTNRPRPDGTFRVGINVPPTNGRCLVRAYQRSAKVAEAVVTVGAALPPFTADFWVTGTGNDLADGRTEATAWRSLDKAFRTVPSGAKTACDGDILGGAGYDKAFHLVRVPGRTARVRGTGRFSLRLQRAHGSTISDGILVLPPSVIEDGPAPDGEDDGNPLQSAVELTDCHSLDIRLQVDAGTDFGIRAKNVRDSYIEADVWNAAEGFRFEGDCTGLRAIGNAHDIHRMVRNTRPKADGSGRNDDYGSVGWSIVGSKGGRILAGARAERCFSKPLGTEDSSFDYVADGGAIELYNATDWVVEDLVGVDCEGGFETGGSSGQGNHRNRIKVALRGDMGAGTSALGKPARSPAILIRNFADSTVEATIDATRYRVGVEVYPDQGQFGGSIERSTVKATVVDRGLPIVSARDVPASTTVAVVKVTP